MAQVLTWRERLLVESSHRTQEIEMLLRKAVSVSVGLNGGMEYVRLCLASEDVFDYAVRGFHNRRTLEVLVNVRRPYLALLACRVLHGETLRLYP